MAVYQPTYRDLKTGEKKTSKVWWYHFTFAGRHIQESSKSTRKTIAAECEKRKRLELERALAGLPNEKPERRIQTVSERLKAYQEGYKTAHREKSIAWVADRSKHLGRLLGKALVSDLTEERIQKYMETRLSESVGNRTVNMELECLSRAIGRTWGELWPKARKLEEPKDVGKALSSEEEQRILDEAARNKSRLIHPFIRTALLTAMRSSEIRTLQWSRVDLANRTLTVGKKAKGSGGGRQIPMNAALAATMEMHHDWLKQEFNVKELKPEWYVFPFSNRIKPVDPTRPATTLKSSWETVREEAGVSCRFHDLRHTTLTKWAEAGVPESTMLALAGHMSRAMLERYSHIRMAAKRAAVDVLTLGTETELAKVPAKDSAKVADSLGAVQRAN